MVGWKFAVVAHAPPLLAILVLQPYSWEVLFAIYRQLDPACKASGETFSVSSLGGQ